MAIKEVKLCCIDGGAIYYECGTTVTGYGDGTSRVTEVSSLCSGGVDAGASQTVLESLKTGEGLSSIGYDTTVSTIGGGQIDSCTSDGRTVGVAGAGDSANG